MSALGGIRSALSELAKRSLRRELRTAPPLGALDFASNDYLALARHPRVVAALRTATRVGSGGSRLLSGAHLEHVELERALATWTGRERALLFSSGYLAIIGAIVTLAPFTRHAYSDAENHACTIDALRLTKLQRTVFPHLAIPDASERVTPALVVTESLFSMSGTHADVAALLATSQAGDVLVVDEAHALGVLGPRGGGLCAQHADARLITIGTLSKALGGAGGFVAGPAEAIDFLVTSARTFVFDTAPLPALAHAMRVAVDIARSDEGDGLRATLRDNVATLCDALTVHGIACPTPLGPIVPLHIGDTADAYAVGNALEANGIYAPAIRPPTVPDGHARLRVTVRADHTRSDLERFARAYASLRRAHA